MWIGLKGMDQAYKLLLLLSSSFISLIREAVGRTLRRSSSFLNIHDKSQGKTSLMTRWRAHDRHWMAQVDYWSSPEERRPAGIKKTTHEPRDFSQYCTVSHCSRWTQRFADRLLGFYVAPTRGQLADLYYEQKRLTITSTSEPKFRHAYQPRCRTTSELSHSSEVGKRQ